MNSQSRRIGLAVVFAGTVMFAAVPPSAGQTKSATTSSATASSSTTSVVTTGLEPWSRALRDKNSTAAYASLRASAFAAARANSGSAPLSRSVTLIFQKGITARPTRGLNRRPTIVSAISPLLERGRRSRNQAGCRSGRQNPKAARKISRFGDDRAGLELLVNPAIAASQPQCSRRPRRLARSR